MFSLFHGNILDRKVKVKVKVRSTVVERATHMQVHAGLSSICTDHRKELISALSCSLNDVK